MATSIVIAAETLNAVLIKLEQGRNLAELISITEDDDQATHALQVSAVAVVRDLINDASSLLIESGQIQA